MTTYQRTGHCAAIRKAIADYPGATYADISKAMGLPVTKLCRDVRKMVERGLIVCAEVDGVKYHSLGRKPLVDFTGTVEERRARKRDSERRYQDRRNAAKRAERAQRNKDALRAIRRPSAPVVASVPCQSVEDYLANGGRVEVLPVSWAGPAYGGRVA